jgi:protein-S-isoprenylcysteine O-methyltransferase Ste14
MKSIFFLSLISIFVAINGETLLLVLQYKRKLLSKLFSDKAFLIHAILALFFWTIMCGLFIFLQLFLVDHPKFHNNPLLAGFGFILILIGLIISVLGFYQLGLKKSLCINFYEEKYSDSVINSSIYRYFSNPEDLGLWFMLIGLTFITGSILNAILSLEFILLMISHINIENIPLKQRYKK